MSLLLKRTIPLFRNLSNLAASVLHLVQLAFHYKSVNGINLAMDYGGGRDERLESTTLGRRRWRWLPKVWTWSPRSSNDEPAGKRCPPEPVRVINGGHELYRARTDTKLYQECLLCGYETPGWTIDRRDRRLHLVGNTHAQASTAARRR